MDRIEPAAGPVAGGAAEAAPDAEGAPRAAGAPQTAGAPVAAGLPDAAVPGTVAEARAALLAAAFPDGIPRLWCPPLTHYDAEGAIDRARMEAHLAFLTRWAGGLLVPGSTGDGWELSPAETEEVVEVAVSRARTLGVHVLVGALDPDASAAASAVRARRALVRPGGAAPGGAGPSQVGGAPRGVGPAGAFGFAVCPPRGAHLSQAALDEALTALLSLGELMALYQLPQVTENEMSPELVASLARRFPNFILFKDTSGADRVAAAGFGPDVDLGGVFLVRGAEGDYARHLKTNGGAYDGLLLSTANSFGEQLHAVIELCAAGRAEEAERLSARLTSVVGEVFRVVEGVPHGNAFANSAKAVDHFFAHGPGALSAPSPRLHGGSSLPREVLRATEDVLRRHDLLPGRGYLGLA